MERRDEKYQELVDKYLKGEATADEANFLNSYFNRIVDQQPDRELDPDIQLRKNRVWQKINPASSNGVRYLKRHYFAIAGAAAVLLVIGLWVFQPFRSAQVGGDPILTQVDIPAGGFGATLTMADGRQVALDTAKKGAVIGTEMTYDDGSPILHGDQVSSSVADILTATTRTGQVYTFVLPDGTKVWLNADSKLSFPAQFGAGERKVKLEGEAFFEVSHDDNKRFYVESKGQLVEDLGTSFNIRAYADEKVQQTTLVEGAAKVNSVELKPGQQARRSAQTPIQVVEADVNQVLGWQQGNFVFRGETLEEVFQVVSRWYDVEVVFQKEQVKYITVGGKVSRSRSIRAVLDLMERTGKVKCSIEGKVVTVR